MRTDERRRAWMEIDPGALRRNYGRVSASAGDDVRVLPMIKADGYGIGAVRVAEELAPLSPWGFGVATVDEGARLREAGFEDRIVVFSPLAGRDAAEIVALSLEPAVTSLAALETFGRAARPDSPLPVHLEVDTGMSRLGLAAGRAGEWIPALRRILRDAPVRLVSVFTHLHSAETDDEATRDQWTRYLRTLEELRGAGVDPGLRHVANSAGALRHTFPDTDLVRPGFYLYGGAPGVPAGEPVVSVRSRILHVFEVDPGRTVGYGATFTAERPSRLAVVGIGYGDGLRRELADGGSVLVRGSRAPIRGSVCMDVIVIDLTELPPAAPGETAGPGEEVTILGREGGERIDLAEMARLCGTNGYEILTGWSARLPRLIVRSDERESGTSEDPANRFPRQRENA